MRIRQIIPTTQEQRQSLSSSRRNRETRLITEVLKSEAFQKYAAGRKAELSRYEINDALHGTLDTPPDKLKPNLDLLRQYAKDLLGLKEFQEVATSVIEFLNYLESKWESIFHD